MLNVLVAGALAVSMLGAPVSMVSKVQPPDAITVELVDYNGTGCPPGSAVVTLSPDKMAFSVKYNQYIAQVGAGSPPIAFRQNCQLAIDVNVPAGFTYAIVSADYRGYGYLEPGASGLQKATYYFQGMPEDSFTQHAFTGPMDDNWHVREETEFPVFAPCGGTRFLEIGTELRVNAGTSDPAKINLLMMDSENHSVETEYHFEWRSC